MRIEHDVKLTFDDVLIRPKRSTLISRSDVTLVRDFKFRHSDTTWTGVPIVLANMDTTGVLEYPEYSRNIGCSLAYKNSTPPGSVQMHGTMGLTPSMWPSLVDRLKIA